MIGLVGAWVIPRKVNNDMQPLISDLIAWCVVIKVLGYDVMRILRYVRGLVVGREK